MPWMEQSLGYKPGSPPGIKTLGQIPAGALPNWPISCGQIVCLLNLHSL